MDCTPTTTFIDPYAPGDELRVFWGTINGVPIYMPMGTKAVVIGSEWLKANPPPPKEAK